MADEIKTVRVISKDSEYHGGRPFTINEEDFDEEQHELVEEKRRAEGEDATDYLIPATFPGAAALNNAGIETFGQLAEHLDTLTEIKGIGQATATAIRAELQA